MNEVNIRRLNIKRVASSYIPNRLNKKDLLRSKSQIKYNKNYFREPNNKIINEKRKSANEEEKSTINIFNKTYTKKPLLQNIKSKELPNKLNKLNSPQSLDKNGIRRETSTISKNTTFYKTKNRLISSIKPNNNGNNFIRTMALSSKRSSFYPNKGRSLSATMLNINNQNRLKRNSRDKFSSKTLGKGGFITALEPIEKDNHSMLNNTNNYSDDRSYFMRKLKGEKRYLSYFDIQRLLYFDRHVYKPDKKFEKQIYDLKNNNSDEFITNFKLDDYKVTILRLFKNKVSDKNYDILKKNFDIIQNIWSFKNTSKHRRTKITKYETTETEREQIYNKQKSERAKRIKEKSESKAEDRNKIIILFLYRNIFNSNFNSRFLFKKKNNKFFV